MQYPPITIVTKKPDGKIIYSGAVFDVLDLMAIALNIR